MTPRPQQVQQNPFDLLMTVILPSNLATRGGGGGGGGGGCWSLLDYASAKITSDLYFFTKCFTSKSISSLRQHKLPYLPKFHRKSVAANGCYCFRSKHDLRCLSP
jgi:hypothetical protein